MTRFSATMLFDRIGYSLIKSYVGAGTILSKENYSVDAALRRISLTRIQERDPPGTLAQFPRPYDAATRSCWFASEQARTPKPGFKLAKSVRDRRLRTEKLSLSCLEVALKNRFEAFLNGTRVTPQSDYGEAVSL